MSHDFTDLNCPQVARAGPSNIPPPHQQQQFPGHINNNVNNHGAAQAVPPLKIPPPGNTAGPMTPGTPGSAPGTPAGPPPPGHPQFEVDLPPELLQQGWRKYWSRRENRPYFFNRANGETLWEMPEMPGAGGFERNSDPLGLGGSVPPQPLPPPQQQQQPPPQQHQQHQPPPQVQGVKRRVSEEMGGGGAKKLIVSGPWDLEIPTNVSISTL